jgi:DnaJ-class molecular chaperone
MLEERLEEIGRVIQTHWGFSFLGLAATIVTVGGGAWAACKWVQQRRVATARKIGSSPVVAVQSLPPVRPFQKMKCPFCDGSGHMQIVSGPAEPCIKCHGKGYIFTDRIGQPKCKFCWGHAYRFGATNTLCPVCDGEGLMPWDERTCDPICSVTSW